MKKVCFLTNNINQCGGIERLISTLSMSFSQDSEIGLTILSLHSKANSISYFPLAEKTRCIHADWPLGKAPDNYLVSYFTENRFDDLVTFHPGISLTISRIIKKIKPIRWIVTEHNDPNYYTWKRKLLNLYAYHKADCLVVLTDTAADYYRRKLIKNVVIIPNPVSFICDEPKRVTKQVLAVGRIEAVKHFDLLEEAFGSRENKYPDWNLCIVGGGSEFEKLEQLASKYTNIKLLGQRSDVQELMLESSFMVISSQYEGFSLVAIEALECGLPIISMELPSIRFITKHYNCCLFAKQNDYSSLAEKIEQLINDPTLNNVMSSEAKECAKQYHPDNIFNMWKVLLNRE